MIPNLDFGQLTLDKNFMFLSFCIFFSNTKVFHFSLISNSNSFQISKFLKTKKHFCIPYETKLIFKFFGKLKVFKILILKNFFLMSKNVFGISRNVFQKRFWTKFCPKVFLTLSRNVSQKHFRTKFCPKMFPDLSGSVSQKRFRKFRKRFWTFENFFEYQNFKYTIFSKLKFSFTKKIKLKSVLKFEQNCFSFQKMQKVRNMKFLSRVIRIF